VESVERGHFTWVGPYGPALDASKSPEFRERAEALVVLHKVILSAERFFVNERTDMVQPNFEESL
jgi:hypothetical protein